jgi:hypothetical protein
MKRFLLVPLVLVLAMATAWLTNIVKLTNCDFAAPYKCEVVHGIGIIPPAAFVTVWFGTDAIPLPETQP